MKERSVELEKILSEYSYEYHVNNVSLVTDFEYDKLFNELVEIYKVLPELKPANSITTKVGNQIDNRFKKVVHKNPMLSLDNAFSFEDLIRFDNNIKKECKNYSYVCELKIDGLAISFIYNNGKFLQSLSRGDGVIGEDVTHNVQTIKELVQTIEFKDELEVRGEVYLSKNEFERLNETQLNNNKKTFANPRNLASGSIRQLDSKICEERNLQLFIYNSPQKLKETHFDTLMTLKDLGFIVNEHVKKVKTIEEVIEYIKFFEEKRFELPYETDGIVIKVNEISNQELLGFTTRVPKWAIAYKYKAEQVQTVINKITFQVGRTGKVTPVANLEPVKLAGSVVSRASLHNEDYIVSKDIRVNDQVIIHKAGEIIPEVIEVIQEYRDSQVQFEMIKNCPVCNSTLIRPNGEVTLYCMNKECGAKQTRQISYFTSIDAMNIEGFGEKIVEILCELNIITKITDIYELNKKYEDLLEIEGFGVKKVDTLLKNIEQSKYNKLEQFITGLGIKNIGKKVSKILVTNFNSLDKLVSASIDEFIIIDEIGEIIATSAYEYFHSDEFKKIKEYVENNGFNLSVDEQIESSFTNKKVVVTGTFKKYKRSDIEKAFELHGAKVSSSVSKNTDLVIVGENAGSKYDKAVSFNITIVNEVELNNIMEDFYENR